MSHKATNWAIGQKGLKPIAKIILWHLCDRYHKDHGCFPSQATLAEDCEISRASLNRHLDELEAQGLIRREKRWDEKSRRQDSTMYRFPFEFAVSRFETGGRVSESTDPVSQKSPEPCLKNGDSRVSNRDTNPVREPGREPVKEPCAQEREDLFSEQDDPPEPEESDRFEEWWAAYPQTKRKIEKAKARKLFERITTGKHRDIDSVSADVLISAMKAYAASGPNPEYVPMPTRWLNGEYWLQWGPGGGGEQLSPARERYRRIVANGGSA